METFHVHVVIILRNKSRVALPTRIERKDTRS